ncbi:hypothetical protein EJB05_44560, partial [Eragrostis curvula]
ATVDLLELKAYMICAVELERRVFDLEHRVLRFEEEQQVHVDMALDALI